MSESNPELERLADRIGELESLDWDRVTRESGLVPETAISKNLRVLSQIASFEADELVEDQGSRQWGSFQLEERIAVDEEGERWAALTENGRAIEVLWPPTHHHEPGHARAELVSVARDMVGLQHEHLVEVLGADAFDGRLGVWMRASSGVTLEDWVRDRELLAPDQIISLATQLCSATEAIHGRKRYQPSLPPSGVVIEETFNARIRRLPHLRPASELRPEEALPTLSAYHFAAPEILTGAAPTRRSDVFAIAALLCWVAGQDPDLRSQESIEALRAHRSRKASIQGLPPELAGLLRECLDPEPSRRPDGPKALRTRCDFVSSDLSARKEQPAASESLWRRIRRHLPFS